MFDRAIKSILDDSIAFLTAHPLMLARFIKDPGWEDADVQKIVDAWVEEGPGCKKPTTVINFGKAAGVMPAYAITMAGETETDETLGRSAGAIALDELQALIDEIEQELGHPANANVRRFQFTYQVYAFADNADLTLAIYNVLKKTMLGADKKLMAFGMEAPSFAGMDLTNDPRWLPDNAFARVWQVVGYAHVLTPIDFDVEPFIQRFQRIDGLFINNAVIGVDARISPRTGP